MLSIIVPIYNVAACIERTLRCLQSQSLTDLEVLLVDDHGTDDSIQVARRVVGDDARFRFLATSSNGGPGLARNVGLQAARGEYVAFCDADDVPDADMYRRLLASIGDADVACCHAMLHDGDRQRPLRNPAWRSRSQYLSLYVAYLWTYLFRRDFLVAQQLTFPPYRTAEDSVFLAEVILCTNRIEVVDACLYHYQVYPQSISHRRGVFRGREKVCVFGQLFAFARRRGLLWRYLVPLCIVYVKKAIITSLRNQ